MRTIHRVITTTAAAAAFGVLFIPGASACGYSTQSLLSANLQPLLVNAHNPLESASPEVVARDAKAASGNVSIVGMWSYQFVAKGNAGGGPPDGTQIDFGYAQWHIDGTEFTNSGGRAPAIQNYCMGVWVQTGPYTYVLNHYAITYDMSGNYTGTANIQESVIVSPGGTKFSGTFTVINFDPNGNKLGQVAGQVTANRVTVDTAP
jgi:hypothetical protein